MERSPRTLTLALSVILTAAIAILLTIRTSKSITAPTAAAAENAVETVSDTISDTISDAVPAAADNWGLSFPTEGQPPRGNATSESLASYNARFLGNTDEKVIYLTFDCGYENGYTVPILDTLAAHNAPAAFFVVGNFLETAPDIVRRMASDGHIVANHTYHHPDMSKIAAGDAFLKELTSLEDAYRDITGLTMPKYYRPPQGKYSTSNLALARDLGYETIFWSLAYVDWYVDDQPTKEEAFAKLIPRIHPGAIVLLHSTSKTNADILDELLTKWEAMGYRFASLDEICGEHPQ